MHGTVAGTFYKVFNASYSPGVRETATTFPINVRILKDIIGCILWRILCFMYIIHVGLVAQSI